MSRFREDDEIKYLHPCSELAQKLERNSLEVSFEDVEKYNQNLATTIIEEYYRYVYLGILHSNVLIIENTQILKVHDSTNIISESTLTFVKLLQTL